MNHGVAEIKRLNLGNLNPIYERELTKLDVHQEEGRWNGADAFTWRRSQYFWKHKAKLHQGEGRWNVSKYGARRRGCRHK